MSDDVRRDVELVELQLHDLGKRVEELGERSSDIQARVTNIQQTLRAATAIGIGLAVAAFFKGYWP